MALDTEDFKYYNTSEVSKVSEVSDVTPVVLSSEEKVRCLKEVISRLKKILHVYEKSLEPNSTYNYRVYCGGVLMYVSSSNFLFNGELVNIVINLTSILQNKLEKPAIKKLVFDSVNFAEYVLKGYEHTDTDKEVKEVGEDNGVN